MFNGKHSHLRQLEKCMETGKNERYKMPSHVFSAQSTKKRTQQLAELRSCNISQYNDS